MAEEALFLDPLSTAAKLGHLTRSCASVSAQPRAPTASLRPNELLQFSIAFGSLAGSLQPLAAGASVARVPLRPCAAVSHANARWMVREMSLRSP